MTLFQLGGAVFSIDVSSIFVGTLIILVSWLGKDKFNRIDIDMGKLDKKIDSTKLELKNDIAQEFYSLRALISKPNENA